MTGGSNPRIAVCAAFYAGLEVVSFAAGYPYPIELIATCNADNTEYESQIAAVAVKNDIALMRRIDANSHEFLEELKRRRIDIVLLAWWPHIIRKNAIEAVPVGWLNMHPALLPYGRGKHAYYWSIVEGSPFGATLHFIDEGIDTGKIVFQREIRVDICDTGEGLYRKGVEESIRLFKDSYHRIVALDFSPYEQDNTIATSHHSSEIETHSRIHMDRTYIAQDLINILRGRTFTKGDSAYFYHGGKKYTVRIMIEEAQV